jgi:hypothetical protein
VHCIKRLLLSGEAFSAWLSVLSRSAYIDLDESTGADHNLPFAVAVMLIPVVSEAGDNQRAG